MKRILMMLFGILLVAGCSKEEENLILGVWDIDYSYFVDGNETYKHVDWHLTWEFREEGFGTEDGVLFRYKTDPERNTIAIQIENTNDKRTWDIIELNRKVLHVAYHSDEGFYIHYIFNRTR